MAKYKKRVDGLFQKSITINGKRKVFYAQTERELTQKILNFQNKEESGIIFKELALDWKYDHFDDLSPTTVKGYTPAYNRLVAEFSNKYVKDITIKDIQLYINRFAGRGKKQKAQKTVRNELSVLSLMLDYGIQQGHIENNPAKNFKLPNGLEKKKRQALTEEQIKIIEKGVDAPFGLFAYFLMYTGCRRGEALAVQFKDIDFESKLISISKSVYYEGNTPHIKSPKTEAGNRQVILLDCLAEKLPKKSKANDYLFSSDGGKTPLANKRCAVNWKHYVEDSNLDWITPHQLRHTYATILYNAGIDVKSAQDLMGHADISTTQNIYTHISKSRKQFTADKLNQYANTKTIAE
ncbi:MAG: site-specific integrase [Oscillospiraceae bacterium]